jgi:16S rRNA processing protein RimM
VPAASPADEPDAVMPGDAVEVGRIVDAWGIKGWVRVQPHSPDPQALFSSKRWYLRPGAGPHRPDDRPLPPLLRITEARRHGDEVVAGIRDVDDRSAAEALRGARIFVARSSFPTAAADEYYWVDLIGLAVVNRAGVALGDVVGLVDNGAHAVLRVQPPAPADGERPAERLIPFVAAHVDTVDREARRIVVDWGLDY